MRKRGMTTTRIVLVLALVGCGGKAGSSEPLEASRDPQPHATGHAAAPAGEQEGHGEHAPTGAVGKFHDVLAPRWHAAKGPQRMTDTCAALPQFHDGAAAIAAEAGAEVKAGADELAAAVDALDATCRAKDAAGFEPAFERVHASFPNEMEAGAKHP